MKYPRAITIALLAALCAGAAKCAAADLAVGVVKKSADPVGRYEKLELTVPVTGLECRNPYDPGEVDLSAELTAPSGRKWSVPGFYAPEKTRDSRDPNGWRVRFSANETGKWKGTVTVKNKDRQARSGEFTFTCADSSHHGWIRVSKKDPYYLVHDDGTPWYGVGHCDHGNIGNDIPLEDASKHGLNVLVHWMFSGHPIESEGRNTENTGLGVYDQTNCRWIDELVDRCEKLEIKLIWIVWFHSQFYNRYSYGWDQGTRRNAYHTLKGGKLPANEWASDPESLAYQDRFHRYVLARWGYSRAVAMWDLLCEINLARQKGAEKWLKRTHDCFRGHDPYGHPTSVGGSGEAWEPWGYKTVDSPNYHSYREQPVGKWVAHLVDRTRAMRAFGKPCYVGEYGTAKPERRLEFMHKANWACTAAGSALTPLYWIHSDRYYKDHLGMPAAEYLKHQGILADFVKDIPFGAERLSPIPAKHISLAAPDKKEPAKAVSDTPFTFEVVPNKKWNAKHSPPPLVVAGPKDGPGGAEVNVHVMGGAHPEIKSPLVFGVKAAGDAKCTLHVEATSKGSGHLMVFVDDGKALERKFAFDPKKQKGEWSSTVNEDVTLDIPPGVHAVRIENRGADWIRIDRYRFEKLLEPTGKERSLMGAKASGCTAAGSVLGMRGDGFTFLYVTDPAFARGGKLSIANMPDGTHRVEWWNTWTGEVILKEEAKTADGVLILRVPESERDMACKLRKSK